ncbi:MAG TPA: type II toxin-antitoxin system VapC family toxin [Candidatus Acidoferrales bacterium]|nr:type II toxin-antitoxin system VapC family toxin [Candidatus Acidoferrales bacterium]
MAIFVADASVALAWCFEDETNSLADALLDRLRRGDRIVVPAHWPTEISNGLLVAQRRKRIRTGQAATLFSELARLPIEMDSALNLLQAETVLALGERHGLSVYDAAYLELAHRRQLPLGTLDVDLLKAAKAEGVILL